MENIANLDPVSAWVLLFWRLKKLILKIVIKEINEYRKLLLFYLIFGRGWEQLRVLFGCLVNYFNVFSCWGVELYVEVEVFLPVFKIEKSKQNDVEEL